MHTYVFTDDWVTIGRVSLSNRFTLSVNSYGILTDMQNSEREFSINYYWSIKGGVGTSVSAAAVAIRLADEERDVVLVDLEGDQPALLGMMSSEADIHGLGDWLRGETESDDIVALCEQVKPGMVQDGSVWSDCRKLLRRGADIADNTDPQKIVDALSCLAQSHDVIVDGGLDRLCVRSLITGPHHTAVCVLQPCYLALSRAPTVIGPYDEILLVVPPGRALRKSDIMAALGANNVERIPWDPRVGRAVDAGTIVSMLPPPLQNFTIRIGSDVNPNVETSTTTMTH